MRTICFDRAGEAKRILKNGIGSTNIRARNELKTAAWYLINKTTYTEKQIYRRLRMAAADYFTGMTEDYIHASIQEILTSVKAGGQADALENTPPSVTI